MGGERRVGLAPVIEGRRNLTEHLEDLPVQMGLYPPDELALDEANAEHVVGLDVARQRLDGIDGAILDFFFQLLQK